MPTTLQCRDWKSSFSDEKRQNYYLFFDFMFWNVIFPWVYAALAKSVCSDHQPTLLFLLR